MHRPPSIALGIGRTGDRSGSPPPRRGGEPHLPTGETPELAGPAHGARIKAVDVSRVRASRGSRSVSRPKLDGHTIPAAVVSSNVKQTRAFTTCQGRAGSHSGRC